MSSLVMIDHQVKGDDTSRELKVTGIDGTYDRYVAIARGLTSSYNNGIAVRVTKSGSAHTSSEYVVANYKLRADTTSILSEANSASSFFV